MAGRVDQIQRVALAVRRGVEEPHRASLDRDAALALEIHVVEELGLHLARRDRARQLQQAIGKRRFAVIDVRDDGEIADAGVGHSPRAGSARPSSLRPRTEEVNRFAEPFGQSRQRLPPQHPLGERGREHRPAKLAVARRRVHRLARTAA